MTNSRIALVAQVREAAGQLEAFNDGAIGLVTDIRREEGRLNWAYDKAIAALAEYDSTIVCKNCRAHGAPDKCWNCGKKKG